MAQWLSACKESNQTKKQNMKCSLFTNKSLSIYLVDYVMLSFLKCVSSFLASGDLLSADNLSKPYETLI